MMGPVIDWTLTERVAGMLAGDPERGTPRPRLGEVAAKSERLVSAYAGLDAPAPLPEPELLTRPEWVRANLRSLQPTLEPLAGRLGEGLGPATPIVRAAGGALLAVELGVVVGYLSRRVLGQYELVILDPEAPSRLLFVGPNLDEASAAFGADEDDLLTWVALHEVTHALQFAGVPWLRDHLAGLLREMLASLEVSIDPSRLLRLPSRDDLRSLVDAVAQGGLIELVTTPAQRETLDRVQATMAVLEGHAEHVMDAVGAELRALAPPAARRDGPSPRVGLGAGAAAPATPRPRDEDAPVPAREGVLRRGRRTGGCRGAEPGMGGPRDDSHARRARGSGLLAGPNARSVCHKVRRLTAR